MKVIVLTNRKVALQSLAIGDAFKLNGKLFIKTTDKTDEREGSNIIWYLDCNNIWFSGWCHPEALVTPVEMEIRINSL